MKTLRFPKAKTFKVLATTPRSQLAEMVIAPGKREGGPDNRHSSDQWLVVTDGQGLAIVEGKKVPLQKGICLLIEKGERHEIRANGRRALRSLNFYAPPVY